MEVREFAQRVLFSSTLAEKLAAAPDDLSDQEPGGALATPREPGRPAGLRFRVGRTRSHFPSHARLIDEEQRGILLHFFANHELLATELMALVLLKFPDAPAAFRRGIVRTLGEEQQHTQWYLRRMAECGVSFGDFSVSRYFWDSIAPMETPLDYVTRLCLTFEQANLDYARHYAELLNQAGDSRTADILSQIYHDEIAHVGYGLKWFRRWKNAADSDWQAYQKHLPFPLSPARGRGNAPFNAEGRRKAGFTDEFIRQIEVFSRSKGRTPHLYRFVADAEAAMARGLDGRGYAPRKEVRALQDDLEILPAFVCHRDDVVLVRRPPSSAHLRKLHQAGFEIPEFEPLSAAGTISPSSLLRTRKWNTFRPWAWCPQTSALFADLDPAFTASHWTPAMRTLFAKSNQVEALGIASTVCRSVEEFFCAAKTLHRQGFAEGLAKAPFGAAGQKNRRFFPLEPEAIRAWVERTLTCQTSLVVEPRFCRVFDFSVHYDCTASGLRRIGTVRVENDRRGQFLACVANRKLCQGIAPEIARFLMGGALSVYEEAIPQQLAAYLQAAKYIGPVGIDAFVFRDSSGSLCLRPIVEINPRLTMGRLTWELLQRVAPGRTVRFDLIRSEACAQEITRIETSRPPQTDPAGRLTSGSLVLNEPTAVLAVLSVSPP